MTVTASLTLDKDEDELARLEIESRVLMAVRNFVDIKDLYKAKKKTFTAFLCIQQSGR